MLRIRKHAQHRHHSRREIEVELPLALFCYLTVLRVRQLIAADIPCELLPFQIEDRAFEEEETAPLTTKHPAVGRPTRTMPTVKRATQKERNTSSCREVNESPRRCWS